jgi:outer membrane autotransporter protein
MTGYSFASGITPEMGMRFLNVSVDEYDNVLGTVAFEDTQYLTGVAGFKYGFQIESESDLKFSPEIRAAATYDFLSDDAIATITTPGAAAYVVESGRLSRLGGEFGIGFNAQYKGLNISLSYDLDLHKDYTSQTGMLKFRFNF